MPAGVTQAAAIWAASRFVIDLFMSFSLRVHVVVR
jgi:hypothetical protein